VTALPPSLAAEQQEERRTALRALLAEPFVDAGAPAYALIRRHERHLVELCADLLGYRLELSSSAARLVKLPTSAALKRPVRIRPVSASGRARPRDEWPALSDRAATMLFLTLAALERAGAQTAIAELARGVREAGAEAEPPVAVDFHSRGDRVAFADGLGLLLSWGVIVHVSGSHASYRRADEQDEDEALLTIDRRRLALLLRDPALAARAERLDDLLDESGLHAPTPEGERRARGQRLARRLIEDPVLYLDELDDDERAYFLGQRARIEGGVERATGMQVERRAEGSAAIEADRALTDLPFPARSLVKQLALLLCDGLEPGEALAREDLRERVRALLAEHREHWNRDPDDPAEVDALTRAATRVLGDLGLVRAHPDAALLVRPMCARFRAATVRKAVAP
jgi:uncharacterized protein (TIGR02678 family)